MLRAMRDTYIQAMWENRKVSKAGSCRVILHLSSSLTHKLRTNRLPIRNSKCFLEKLESNQKKKKKANENTRAEETSAIILVFILSGTVLSPLHVLSQSILRNCMRFHYGPHFADEETGSERLSNFLKPKS